MSPMESCSKQSHDPFQRPQTTTPKPTHLHHHFPKLLSIALVLSSFIESYLILQKSNPTAHIVPLIILLFLANYFLTTKPNVYLVDFSCYKPPSYCRVPFSTFIEHTSLFGTFNKESVEFMGRVLANSGQGQETYLPPALHCLPPRPFHDEAIGEVHMVLFPVLEDVLRKTGISSRDVDILIVNCSGLAPSPSLASIVINRFKMREDVKSYNVSGMGCSASMIAVDMAYHLLRVDNNNKGYSNAVVLSTEILTTGWYPGNEQSKLALNCVFRMGSAAILLSNRQPRSRIDSITTPKYRLVRSIRTQRAFTDRGYHSAWRDEDSNGVAGVRLSRDILPEANATLQLSITSLGLSILPAIEKLSFILSVLNKKLLNRSTETYTPNFKSVIDHFCLPISGVTVIREIGKALKLNERDMEPVLATLHRFGNQSSSSLWYELAYIEAKERVKRGDKVWQMGMGSGPKCVSVVWECVRPIVGETQRGPWAGSIDKYPRSFLNPDK